MVTPFQKGELLFAKSEILTWTIDKLNDAVAQAGHSLKFSPAKDKNGCYSQSRLCWIRLGKETEYLEMSVCKYFQ